MMGPGNKGFGAKQRVGVEVNMDTGVVRFAREGKLLTTTLTIPADVRGRGLYPVVVTHSPGDTAAISFPAAGAGAEWEWAAAPPDPRAGREYKRSYRTSGAL